MSFNGQRRGEIRKFIEDCETSGIYPWDINRLREEYNSQLPGKENRVDITWVADLDNVEISRWLSFMTLSGHDIQIQTPWWL